MQGKRLYFESDFKMAFVSHLKTHGRSDENDKLLAGIEEALPKKSYRGVGSRTLSPEESAGVPNTAGGEVTDRDNVTWYGEGLEKDTV